MKLKNEKTGSFWLYVVFGILIAGIGVILLPVWPKSVFFSSWGSLSVNIMISGLLLGYILLYLIKRINRYSGTSAQLVAIVELVLMAVIAVVCTVSAFVESVSFGNPCQIFGLALWTRGASGVFTGYYCDSNVVKEAEKEKKAKNKKKKAQAENKKEEIDTNEEPRGRVDDFTVWRLALAIALISAGTYLFVSDVPPFTEYHLQWVFSCAIAFIGAFFVVYGLALKPKKLRVNEVLEQKENASKSAEESNKEKIEGGESKTELDEGKVKFSVDKSATAMTKTAAYDAVKEEKSLTVIDKK